MNYSEVKALLWQEHEIEKEQREGGYNVNYQNLPYESVDVPKIPEDYYFEKGNIFISKQYRYAPVPRHTHEFVEFNYMLSGTSTQYINGEKYVLRTGDILLFDRESIHEIDELGENDILINLLLKEESITTEIIVNMVKSNSLVNQFLMDISNQYTSHNKFIYFHCSDNEAVQEIMKKILVEYFGRKKYFLHAINLLLSVLLIELTRVIENENMRQSAKDNSEIIEILKYIDTHYKNLTLMDLAEHFGYNSNYISNKIKKETGKTFQSLINYSRYQLALELMSDTDKSLEEIAYDVGFNAVPSLYKLIAKYTKTSPSTLRKALKDKKTEMFE